MILIVWIVVIVVSLLDLVLIVVRRRARRRQLERLASVYGVQAYEGESYASLRRRVVDRARGVVSLPGVR